MSELVAKTLDMRLLDLLEYGLSNGKTSTALAQQVACSPRKVREMLSELKQKGYGIGSHPDDGFYMIDTQEDAEKTLRHLYSRLTAIVQGIKATEHFCREKFGDQMRISEVPIATKTVFSRDKYLSHEEQSRNYARSQWTRLWVDAIHGKEVVNRHVGIYEVEPEWCIEVLNEAL